MGRKTEGISVGQKWQQCRHGFADQANYVDAGKGNKFLFIKIMSLEKALSYRANSPVLSLQARTAQFSLVRPIIART
jgi:hypothetical protein